MKIVSTIRGAYEDRRNEYEQLQTLVDGRMRAAKRDSWHYVSRIKDPERFALKVETGRFDRIDQLEDYFACTVVVENRAAIPVAEKIVEKLFYLKERRPKNERFTSKSADAFPFDDLRMYVEWKDDPDSRPTGLDGFLFEVQIKTFLQHAWSIATHDLTYKSADIDWGQQRIASQVKALLEHAEITIAEAEVLSKTSDLRKTNRKTTAIKKAISFLRKRWNVDALPKNLVRLATTTVELSEAVDIPIGELDRIVRIETEKGRGASLENLSPYGVIVQSVMLHTPEKILGSPPSRVGELARGRDVTAWQ